MFLHNNRNNCKNAILSLRLWQIPKIFCLYLLHQKYVSHWYYLLECISFRLHSQKIKYCLSFLVHRWKIYILAFSIITSSPKQNKIPSTHKCCKIYFSELWEVVLYKLFLEFPLLFLQVFL